MEEMGGGRIKRLIPPLWCAVAIYVLIKILFGFKIKWQTLLLYAFNIQGIDRFFTFISVPIFDGLGQTWFVTEIAICYILMVCFKKCKCVEAWICRNSLIVLVFSILLQCCLALIGIQISYILQFFVGYFIKMKFKNNWVSLKIVLILTISSFLVGCFRLITRKIIDGTVLYDMVIAPVSFNVIAILIVALLISMCRLSFIRSIVFSKTWRILDIASYPLFLTHYMFLRGPVRVMLWIKSEMLQIIAIFVLTAITGLFVLFVTNKRSLLSVIMNENEKIIIGRCK